MNISNDDEMKELYSTKLNEFYEIGIMKPIHSLRVNDKDTFIQMMTVTELLRIKAEIDQFKQGMECLGVVSAIQWYPDLLKGFFTVGKKVLLTAGTYLSFRELMH